MLTLKEQIQSVKNQFELSKKAKESKHIIDEFEIIYKRLLDPHESLKKIFLKLEILKRLPREFTQMLNTSEDLASQCFKCMKNLESFKAQWEVKNYKARSCDELANAQASLVKLVETLDKVVHECWDLWVEHITIKVTVETLKLESQKSIPGLDEVYTGYVESHRELTSLLKQIPNDSTKVERIITLCERMVEFKNNMQWDIDPEIAEFFDHLDRNSQGKVPLSMFSIKIMSWLEEHGYLDHFVIQRRGTRN